jgi:hypothetical protein
MQGCLAGPRKAPTRWPIGREKSGVLIRPYSGVGLCDDLSRYRHAVLRQYEQVCRRRRGDEDLVEGARGGLVQWGRVRGLADAGLPALLVLEA